MAHESSDPFAGVPAFFLRDAKRYEATRQRYHRSGLYQKPYLEMLLLLLTKANIDLLAELNIQKSTGDIGSVRRQFFPNLNRAREFIPDLPAAKKAIERQTARRLAQAQGAMASAAAWSASRGFGLSAAYHNRAHLEGIPCVFTCCHTSATYKKGKGRYARCRTVPQDGEFMILFVDIDEEDVVHDEAYILPMEKGLPLGMRDIYLPLKRKRLTRLSRHYEPYRGEKGVELLKAAIERKRLSCAPVQSTAA